MADFGNCTTAIINTDTNAVVSGPCLVWGIYQGPNTSGTDTTYELHDALTVTGAAKLFSRVLSISMNQPFTRPVRFSVGISVNKTNGGDSQIQILYEKLAS